MKFILLIPLLTTLTSANIINAPISPHDDAAIGSTRVNLDSMCKNVECNLGNFITDAMVDWNAQQFTSETAWTDASIAIIEATSIKAGITKTQSTTSITKADVDSCLATDVKVVVVEVTGQQLKDVLEQSVRNMKSRKDNVNEFLQVSGLHITYNLEEATKVQDVHVLCANCIVPEMRALNLTEKYKILMEESLAKGSNGYEMFKDKIVRELNVTDNEMFVEFLKKKSPIYPAVEWRITVNSASGLKVSIISMFLSTIALLLKRFL
jgi:5'-nucleotidase